MGESVQAFVQRLALEKAQACWHRASCGLPVLGADTAIELNGAMLGKPADKREALVMLDALSGREHHVYTGLAVIGEGRHAHGLSCTRIQFRDISSEERDAYVASGESLDKAGAYGLQGKAAVFVQALSGSYSGVVGLPLFETAKLLREFGISLL
jgi:septum formation protein